MQVPIRRTHRPRITLGQISAAVAVASLPLGPLMRMARRVDDPGSALVIAALGIGLVSLSEMIFWSLIVANIDPLRRLLGMPRWTHREVIVDPTGIRWVDEIAEI